MKYISNGGNIDRIKKEVDDKLLDIISSLLKSKNYFYDRTATANNIASVNAEIDSLKELIQALPTKSNEELVAIAQQYGVTLADGLTSDFIVAQIQDAIYSKIDELTKESNILSSDFNNYKRTYIYTMETHVESLNQAIDKTYDIDLKTKYEFLLGKFQSLISKLQVLSGWVLALAPEMDKFEDLDDTRSNIKFKLSHEYRKVADVSSSNLPQDQIDTLEKETSELLKELSDLEPQFEECKARVLQVFDENQVQINFKDLKDEMFEDLLYIKANMTEASQNGALSINESDLDKYMDAFYTMFYYPIIKECEFKTYLAENGVLINENDKTFGELTSVEQKVIDSQEKVNEQVHLPSASEELKNDEQVVTAATEQIVPEKPVNYQHEVSNEDTNQAETEPQESSYTSIDYAAGVEVQADTVWEPIQPVDNPAVSVQAETAEPVQEPVASDESSESTVPEQPVVSSGQTVFGVVSTIPTSDAALADAKAKAKATIDEKENSGVRVRGGDL